MQECSFLVNIWWKEMLLFWFFIDIHLAESQTGSWLKEVDIYLYTQYYYPASHPLMAWLVVGSRRDPLLNSSYYLWCHSDSTVTMASWLSDDNSDLRGWGGFPWGPQSLVIKPYWWETHSLPASPKIRLLIEIHYNAMCWTLWYKPVYTWYVFEGARSHNWFIHFVNSII